MIDMSWEDIIKVSPLEREIAEEYAPKDMKNFNDMTKVIEMLQADYKEFFQGLSEKAQRGEIDREKFAEYDRELNGLLRQLKAMRNKKVESSRPAFMDRAATALREQKMTDKKD